MEQRSLILTAFGLMMTVVIPTVLMAVGFAWKYRASDKDVKYSPNWSHLNKVEAVVWTVPILIILFLAVLTRKTTHALEPSKPPTHDEKSIAIEVVSMDWKWSFTYPEQGIATVNEIVFPVNVPVYFKVTSNSVMNPFFIPRSGSQIYVMARMQTQLYLIADEAGTYDSISVSYSGSGFSGMKFKTIAIPDRMTFDQWVEKAKQSPGSMDSTAAFDKVAVPSEYNEVEYFLNVKLDLFEDVVSKFMFHESMSVPKPEDEYAAHDGVEDMNISHAETAH